MSFITPCFIRTNTPELRAALEALGYKPTSRSDFEGIKINEPEANGIYRTVYTYYVTTEMAEKYGYIDCVTNEPLFLAIAALRDDTDYMQWHTDGSDFILCDREDWVDMYSVLCCGKGHDYQYVLDKFHKATVVELINHFKE